jgi:hypothetical protein
MVVKSVLIYATNKTEKSSRGVDVIAYFTLTYASKFIDSLIATNA